MEKKHEWSMSIWWSEEHDEIKLKNMAKCISRHEGALWHEGHEGHEDIMPEK
jgi:hypothetical protein